MSKEAATIGKTNNVDVVIAIGGGSPIDCAKLTSAAITSKKTINNLIGILKVKQMPLPLIAVPTTAGTGSEVSAGAVISDDVTHMKFIMISPKIVPNLAVLDGETMTGLPKQWTAGTGFDALTHAVEAYIGFHYNADAKRSASEAVAAINKYLKRAYDNGSDIEARGALSLASYKAGLAMNKCSLGYAHAFGHRLTGFYDLPHGVAVGMILPHVIKYNKKAAEKEFAELAVACDLGKDSEPIHVLAEKFEKNIFDLYDKLKLPKKCDKLKKSDYDQIMKEAFKETNATYGVPKYMTKKEAAELLDKILP
jgi:alcohol dehydrogenase